MEGFHPYPHLSEIASILKGKPLALPEIKSVPIEDLPILVTAKWCPFTLPAKDLWTQASRAVKAGLRVVYADAEDGYQIMNAANVAGVPCLITASRGLFYGLQISPSEAEAFLKTSALSSKRE